MKIKILKEETVTLNQDTQNKIVYTNLKALIKTPFSFMKYENGNWYLCEEVFHPAGGSSWINTIRPATEEEVVIWKLMQKFK